MLGDLFHHTTIPVLQEVVYFTQARHEVLAGNIANIDTPGYRTADLSPEIFEEHLRSAIARRDATEQPVSTGVKTTRPGDAMHEVRDAMKTILYHDESDIGLEQQVLQMSKNQSTHNMAIALMNSQFRLLEAALSERV